MSEQRSSGVAGKILLLFMAAALVGVVWHWWNPGEALAWGEDYDVARAESRASGKPLLVYFTADWCGPCQQMRRTTWSDARVKEALNSYVPVKIDIDQQRGLAQQFGVRSIPSMVLMHPNGEVASAQVGFVSASDMLSWLGD